MSHPSPCMALQYTFLCSIVQSFDIIWPHCVAGTQTCISAISDAGRKSEKHHNLRYRISPFQDLDLFCMANSGLSVWLSSSFPGGNPLTNACWVIYQHAGFCLNCAQNFLSTLSFQTSSGNNHPSPHLLCIKLMKHAWFLCYLFANKISSCGFQSPMLFNL